MVLAQVLPKLAVPTALVFGVGVNSRGRHQLLHGLVPSIGRPRQRPQPPRPSIRQLLRPRPPRQRAIVAHCTVRDGVHGAAQGGIYGKAGKGAYSIVLSGGNHYSDVNKGDTIWYSGTDAD
jgi:hypothetical protein